MAILLLKWLISSKAFSINKAYNKTNYTIHNRNSHLINNNSIIKINNFNLKDLIILNTSNINSNKECHFNNKIWDFKLCNLHRIKAFINNNLYQIKIIIINKTSFNLSNYLNKISNSGNNKGPI